MTKYWETGELNTNQADEAQITIIATVQDLKSESDEKEESLWSERALHCTLSLTS